MLSNYKFRESNPMPVSDIPKSLEDTRDEFTECRTKCHTIDCARNTFLLLQKHLTSSSIRRIFEWLFNLNIIILPESVYLKCVI